MSNTASYNNQSGKDWKYGLFGCFDDPKLCVLSFFVPCYAIGKNAESLSEDCILHGLLSLVGLNFGPVTRWRMRMERRIAGSMLMDVLVHAVCPCCALVQEAREIGWTTPKDFNDIGRAGGDNVDVDNEQNIDRE